MTTQELSQFEQLPQERRVGLETLNEPKVAKDLGHTAFDPNHSISDQLNGAATGDLAARLDVTTFIHEAANEKIDIRAELTDVQESLHSRVKEALDASDFEPTREVRGAITGYYTDHYKLAYVLESAIAGRIDSAAAEEARTDEQPFAETAAMDGAIKEIIELASDPARRQDTLKRIDNISERMLFREECIGALTIGDREKKVIKDVRERLEQKLIEEGLGHKSEADGSVIVGNRSVTPVSWLIDAVDQDSGRIYEDSRFAGQLLFHNTGSFGDLALSGYVLKSRTQQLAETGSFHAQTDIDYKPGENMHSNVPHWSEQFDYAGYKLGAEPGTLAVPLAEIIKTAPFARGKKYGVVRIKPDKLTTVSSQVTVNEGTTSVLFGGTDRPGAGGGDRVFFADNRAAHAEDSSRYAIDAGRGMKSANGPLAFQIFTSAENAIYRTEGSSHGYTDRFGAGENFPSKVVLEFDEHNHDTRPGKKVDVFTQDPNERMARFQGAESRLTEQIRELQAKSRSRPEFKDEFVVPLRQGVMEYIDESGLTDAFGYYRQHIRHSAIPSDVAKKVSANRESRSYQPQKWR